MTEVTIEAMEKLLTKHLQNLPTKKDLQDSFDELAERIDFLSERVAYKEDLKQFVTVAYFDKRMPEQAVSMNFIESQIATLRKDLGQLSKRTKEDDSDFVKELLK